MISQTHEQYLTYVDVVNAVVFILNMTRAHTKRTWMLIQCCIYVFSLDLISVPLWYFYSGIIVYVWQVLGTTSSRMLVCGNPVSTSQAECCDGWNIWLMITLMWSRRALTLHLYWQQQHGCHWVVCYHLFLLLSHELVFEAMICISTLAHATID